MKKHLLKTLLTAAVCISLTACATKPAATPTPSEQPASSPTAPATPDASPAAEQDFTTEANTFAQNLVEAKYDLCEAALADTVKKSLPAAKIKEAWEATTKSCGSYEKIADIQTEKKDAFTIMKLFMSFADKGIITQLTFNAEGKIEGVWFNYYDKADDATGQAAGVPAGLEETAVTVGEGDYQLKGLLTKKTGATSTRAVVLVHGSGPQDMDETLFGNKPFRDIAYGLAETGIDVLRYDKRTFAYADKLKQSNITNFTVKEETIDDAVSAAKLLSSMGYKNIFVAGHSLGGMLAPRINEECGDLLSGVIILAGSTRTLTDIIIDQSMAAITKLPPEQQKALNEQIDNEKNKLAALNTFTDEQLIKETVFGLPAYYIKEMNSYDTATLAAKITKPVLVLQGGMDFQVYSAIDYPLWKEALKGNNKAKFVLYDDLSHLFMKAPVNPTNTVEDYKAAAKVNPQVIADIATFVKGE